MSHSWSCWNCRDCGSTSLWTRAAWKRFASFLIMILFAQDCLAECGHMAGPDESCCFPSDDAGLPVFVQEVLCGRARHGSFAVQDYWDWGFSWTPCRFDQKAQSTSHSYQHHQVCDNGSRRVFMSTERFLGFLVLWCCDSEAVVHGTLPSCLATQLISLPRFSWQSSRTCDREHIGVAEACRVSSRRRAFDSVDKGLADCRLELIAWEPRPDTLRCSSNFGEDKS